MRFQQVDKPPRLLGRRAHARLEDGRSAVSRLREGHRGHGRQDRDRRARGPGHRDPPGEPALFGPQPRHPPGSDQAGRIELLASSPDQGEAHESLPAEYSGADIEVGFNAQYLIDFLAAAGGDAVQHRAQGRRQPGRPAAPGRDGHRIPLRRHAHAVLGRSFLVWVKVLALRDVRNLQEQRVELESGPERLSRPERPGQDLPPRGGRPARAGPLLPDRRPRRGGRAAGRSVRGPGHHRRRRSERPTSPSAGPPEREDLLAGQTATPPRDYTRAPRSERLLDRPPARRPRTHARAAPVHRPGRRRPLRRLPADRCATTSESSSSATPPSRAATAACEAWDERLVEVGRRPARAPARYVAPAQPRPRRRPFDREAETYAVGPSPAPPRAPPSASTQERARRRDPGHAWRASVGRAQPGRSPPRHDPPPGRRRGGVRVRLVRPGEEPAPGLDPGHPARLPRADRAHRGGAARRSRLRARRRASCSPSAGS